MKEDKKVRTKNLNKLLKFLEDQKREKRQTDVAVSTDSTHEEKHKQK